MNLAIMQPYLFPYLGYYQLAYCSDMFIFYDDVNYIKGGYINRNNILTKNGKLLITLPVEQASSFKKINELNFSSNVKKILTTIYQSYSKAPLFNDVYPIIEKTLKDKNRNVANITSNSIINFFKYLNIDFNYCFSSELEYDKSLDAKQKIYEMCDIYQANRYINTIGGKKLYDKSEFKLKGIDLLFINNNSRNYQQFNNNGGFIGNLSIIDLLMNIQPNDIIYLLKEHYFE